VAVVVAQAERAASLAPTSTPKPPPVCRERATTAPVAEIWIRGTSSAAENVVPFTTTVMRFCPEARPDVLALQTAAVGFRR
jgi:hypothetical protein